MRVRTWQNRNGERWNTQNIAIRGINCQLRTWLRRYCSRRWTYCTVESQSFWSFRWDAPNDPYRWPVSRNSWKFHCCCFRGMCNRFHGSRRLKLQNRSFIFSGIFVAPICLLIWFVFFYFIFVHFFRFIFFLFFLFSFFCSYFFLLKANNKLRALFDTLSLFAQIYWCYNYHQCHCWGRDGHLASTPPYCPRKIALEWCWEFVAIVLCVPNSPNGLQRANNFIHGTF